MTTPSPKVMSIATVAAILTLLASTCMAKNVLTSGELGLYAGQSLHVNQYKFVIQQDCNLVLYEYNNLVIWASNTDVSGKNGCRAVLQRDGNFVIYDADGSPVWASNSWRGIGNYVLLLQEDRNVVIYGPNILATGTNHKNTGEAVVTAMNGTVDGGSVVGPVVTVNQNVNVIRKAGTGVA